jgi:hypothetical protein
LFRNNDKWLTHLIRYLRYAYDSSLGLHNIPVSSIIEALDLKWELEGDIAILKRFLGGLKDFDGPFWE